MIPVLIESCGPCESSWISRRGFKRIRIQGLQDTLLIVDELDNVKVLKGSGEFELELEGESLKVGHKCAEPITVELF